MISFAIAAPNCTETIETITSPNPLAVKPFAAGSVKGGRRELGRRAVGQHDESVLPPGPDLGVVPPRRVDPADRVTALGADLDIAPLVVGATAAVHRRLERRSVV